MKAEKAWPLPRYCKGGAGGGSSPSSAASASSSSSSSQPRPELKASSSCARDTRAASDCDYPPIWLIPGTADTSCTRDVSFSRSVFDIHESTVKITPEFIQLPGEFNIHFEASLKEGIANIPSQYLAKAEYSWLNFPDMQNLKCQETDPNGCGGYGNNCVYCDLCNELEELDSSSVKPRFQQFVQQVRGMKCPEKIGRYRYRRSFCLNSWRAFDEDGDCKLDFVRDLSGDYRRVFRALRQDSWGTLEAKFHLSHDATLEQQQKKEAFQADVRRNITANFERAFQGRPIPQQRIERRFRQRVNAWHKKFYLPWLAYENQVSCLKVSFDVCDKQPVPSTQWGRKWECPR